VNYLRRKIDVEFNPKLIGTVRGVGYEIRAGGVESGLCQKTA
jgi:DNA-binding response OmpR family regulator